MAEADSADQYAIPKPKLQLIIDYLLAQGYRVIAPTIRDQAILFDEVHSTQQLPIGLHDDQEKGRYRLVKSGNDNWFEFVVGANSLKNYTFPPRQTLLTGKLQSDGQWEFQHPQDDFPPTAIIGARACDLQALLIQDRVFWHGDYCDEDYAVRRQKMLLIAVNCQRSAPTCFCHSMDCGPAVKEGYDLALTETENDFVIQVGSSQGEKIVTAIAAEPCHPDLQQAAQRGVQALLDRMQAGSHSPAVQSTHSVESAESVESADGDPRPVAKQANSLPVIQRQMETTNLRDLLYANLHHERWEEVAQRCLACGNCTLVCPTCFCSTVEDVPSLDETEIRRDRTWASCFTDSHSYMNSGTVRKSTASRYRQWLTHKLGGWIDQFGTSGCVGCGRCITWCPVGIDLTEEVAAIQQSVPKTDP